jgi:hypothetical protein
MSPAKTPRRRTCAQMVVHELLVETKPEYRAHRLEVEQQTRRSIESGQATRVAAKLITIPVVVHVVHRTAEENISDAQVNSQIKALNRDYRAKNADKSQVPADWRLVAGGAKPTSSSRWPPRTPAARRPRGSLARPPRPPRSPRTTESSRRRLAAWTPGRPTAT